MNRFCLSLAFPHRPWLYGIAIVSLAFVSPELAAQTLPAEGAQNVAATLNHVGSSSNMNNVIGVVFGFLLLLLLPVIAWVLMHNSLVSKEEAVFTAWSQVESNYQRRNDLVPSLTESVSRFIKHEAETLSSVTGQRSAPYAALQEAVSKLQAAQAESSDTMNALGGKPPAEEGALNKVADSQEQVLLGMKGLLAVAEGYPELRSSDQFLTLQAQLEGTENRINVARLRFNEAAQDFNAAIRKMPISLVASANGMQRKAYFTADEGASRAKKLNLD
jgi:LemA protein